MSTFGFVHILVIVIFAEFGFCFHHNFVITILAIADNNKGARQVLCHASHVHTMDGKKFFEIGIDDVDIDTMVEPGRKIKFNLLSTLLKIKFENGNSIAQIFTQLGQGANVKVWKTMTEFSTILINKKKLRFFYDKLVEVAENFPEIAKDMIWNEDPTLVEVPCLMIIHKAGLPHEIIRKAATFRAYQVNGKILQEEFPLLTVTLLENQKSVLHTLLKNITTSTHTPYSLFVTRDMNTDSTDPATLFRIFVMGAYFEPKKSTGELEISFMPHHMVARIERQCLGNPKMIVKVLAGGIAQEYAHKLIFEDISITRIDEGKDSRNWQIPKEFETLEGMLAMQQGWADARIYLTYIPNGETMFGSAMRTPEAAWHEVRQIRPTAKKVEAIEESAEPILKLVMHYRHLGDKFWPLIKP